MTKTIAFELVSPEERLVSEPVAMAVIPGVEGELGVGPGHARFIVALKPGTVRLFANDMQQADSRDIFIVGGFADITGESCTVLAEEAVNVSELSEAALNEEIKTLKHDLALAQEDFDKARIAKRLEIARLQMEAVTGTVNYKI